MVLHHEYEAFIGFTYVMQELNWRCLYLEKMPKLRNLLKKMSIEIQRCSEDVHQHLEELNVLQEGAFSQFFIAVCSYNCPLSFAFNVFDLFIIEGEQVLIRLIINSIKMQEETILSMDSELVIVSLLIYW